MIVYLSGPITGMRDRNRRNFNKAQKKIEETLTGQKPLQIINPNKLAEIVEFQFSGKNRNLYHVVNHNGRIICVTALKISSTHLPSTFLKDGKKAKAQCWSAISPKPSASPASKP